MDQIISIKIIYEKNKHFMYIYIILISKCKLISKIIIYINRNYNNLKNIKKKLLFTLKKNKTKYNKLNI